MERLEKLRRERDRHRVEEALGELKQACEKRENIMPAMMKAVQAYVTLGEVGEVFRQVYGNWNAPLPI